MENAKENIKNDLDKKYTIYTILAGVLGLIPIGVIFLEKIELTINLFYPEINFKEIIYNIIYYTEQVISLMIYIFVLKAPTKKKKIILIIVCILLAFTIVSHIYMENTNKGLDYIGDAIVRGFLYSVFLYSYLIGSFILFINYAKESVFKRKVTISIIIILLFVIIRNVIQRFI